MNSVIEESLDGLSDKTPGGHDKRVHHSVLTNTFKNNDNNRDEYSTTFSKKVVESSEVSKLKKKNQKEIENLEALD